MMFDWLRAKPRHRKPTRRRTLVHVLAANTRRPNHAPAVDIRSLTYRRTGTHN